MSTLRFTPEHEWLCLEETGELTIGITQFAQHALGDVVFVQLPEPGHYAKGDEVVVLESVKAASEIAMPLAGEVMAVNQLLADEPEQVNTLPLLEGWFFRVQPDHPVDLDAFMDQAAYNDYLAEEA